MQVIKIKSVSANEMTTAIKRLAHEVNKTAISIDQLNTFIKPFHDMAVKRQEQNKLVRKKFSIKI